ncbi:MAG: hypothetical protein AAF684_10095, partial [Pseudomonadota bacterium]
AMRAALILIASVGTAAAQDSTQAIQFSTTPLHVFEQGARLYAGARVSKAYVFARSSGLSAHTAGDSGRTPTGLAARLETTGPHGIAVGVAVEGFVSLNSTDGMRFEGDRRVFDGDIRRAEAAIAHRLGGALRLGYGPMATEGVLESDLSGTQVATGVDLTLIGGDFSFDESTTGAAGGRVRYADAALDADGLGRDLRARWWKAFDGGFRADAAVDWRGDFDLAVRYRTPARDGWRFAGAFGYADGVESPRNGDGSLWSLSASVRAPWETSLTFAAAAPDPIRPLFRARSSSEFYYYAKIGQAFDIFGFGETAVSFDYGFTQWRRRVREDVERYGVAVTQSLFDDRLALFATLHTSDLDEAVEDSVVDELQVFSTGFRLRY